MQPTRVLPIVGLDVGAISSISLSALVPAGRLLFSFLFLSSTKVFQLNFGCQAEVFQLPHHRQYLFVSSNFIATFRTMTEEEILAAINKVEGIQGMTVNERLFTTGLMDEFDKSKHEDPQKTRFILEHLQVDKPSVDKILKIATTKRIVALVMLTAINIGLTMFLISVLADNFMEYKKAFWITTPIILGLTYFFGKISIKQMTNRQHQSNSILFYLTIVVSIVNVLILALNIYCWVDLFDGTTSTMFP